MPALIETKSERLQQVLADIREYALLSGLDPGELIARWLKESLETNTMNFEGNRES